MSENVLESWSGMEWSGVEWSGLLVSKLFQIVLAGSASKPLICPTKIDFALWRFSDFVFSWLQHDQQDELHLQFFTISRKVQLVFFCQNLVVFNMLVIFAHF